MKKINLEFYINEQRTQVKMKDWLECEKFFGRFESRGLEARGYQRVTGKRSRRGGAFVLRSRSYEEIISKKLYYGSRKRADDKNSIVFYILHNSPIIMRCNKCVVVTRRMVKTGLKF